MSDYVTRREAEWSEFEALANKIHKWQAATFPCAMVYGAIRHMAKELTELADAIEGRRPQAEIDEEFADVFFMFVQLHALVLASRPNSPLARAINEKLKKNMAREWPKQPGPDGAYHHIKSEEDGA